MGLIISLVAVFVLSGAAITSWRGSASKISLEEVRFTLKPDGRYIEATVKASGLTAIDLAYILINKTKILTFSVDKSHLEPGERGEIDISFHWLPESNYEIEIKTKQESRDEVVSKSPPITNRLSIDIKNVSREYLSSDVFRINVGYLANFTGQTWVKIMLFGQKIYQNVSRPIYIFSEPRYLTFEAQKRVDFFLVLSNNYGIKVNRLDWDGLADLANYRTNALLIIPNPLKNASGNRIFDSMPSCLVDPDEDGSISEHSAYNRSIIYDWEKHDGLVLITYGSDKVPLDYIIAKNGTSYKRMELGSSEYFATGITIPSFAGWGKSPIALTRAGQSLSLSPWSSYWFLVEDRIAKSVDYYAYGYGVNERAVKFNEDWIEPAFIRVGAGGLLLYGLAEQLDEDFAENLLLMILHSPWNSEWLGSKAWQYDSGSTSYIANGGMIQTEDKISTGWIKNLNATNVNIRLIILAYDADGNRHLVSEKTMNYSLKK